MVSDDAGPARTVLAWHDALNAGDVDRLLALCHADVEVGGPRGSGRGAQLVRDWFGRAGIRLTPVRVLPGPSGDAVIVEQDARWVSDAQVHRLVSVFRVRDGKIAGVLRFPDVHSALAVAD